ncbi:class I SAM-dependent methyltransferase [Lentzea sp. NEAU-D13]|uniref:Class I SAM-dependent methyltransferase n=1 Tax=Lentzea alba TaxID=2714351 RepID=A0A7C9RVV0_9PSEU|nr:class I SAM-dependent methyltransferase [Lentzea alba]NGY64230.1 class I SAM-dependent methyltransferase [Lentzea alba]
MRDAASAAGENAVASADLAGLGALADRLDEAALLVIAFTLRRSGLFPDPAATHSLQDVLAATKAAPRHHRIVRRWLAVLLRENMITLADGRYRDLRAVEAAEVERALAGLDAAARGFAHGPGLTRFFQQSAAYLPDLLTDAISLQALLFAGDDLDVADDVYRRNLASRYTNQAAAAVIRDFVRQRHHPAKVLEVGAGVGGTTAEVLPELDGLGVDYLFTDVTRYFLTVAEERFGSRIRYGIFDINAAEQQIPAHSMDVVLAANVLHNARHAGRVLGGLRELLAPGGLLVFIETCRDHYQLMTSMQFLMSPPASSPDADFEDFRRGTDRIFPSRQEWLSELESAEFREAFAVPEADHPLTRIGQHVFIATA